MSDIEPRVLRLERVFGKPQASSWERMKRGRAEKLEEWRFTFESNERYVITIIRTGTIVQGRRVGVCYARLPRNSWRKITVGVRKGNDESKQKFSPREWDVAEDFLFDHWDLSFHRFKMQE